MLQQEGVINGTTTIKREWDQYINHSRKRHKLRVFHLFFQLLQGKLQVLSLALGTGSKKPLNVLHPPYTHLSISPPCLRARRPSHVRSVAPRTITPAALGSKNPLTQHGHATSAHPQPEAPSLTSPITYCPFS